jgi:hypothetical protein
MSEQKENTIPHEEYSNFEHDIGKLDERELVGKMNKKNATEVFTHPKLDQKFHAPVGNQESEQKKL